MALNGQYTEYLGLYKPSLEDSPPDITSINSNWDIIAEEIQYLQSIGLPFGANKKLELQPLPLQIRDVYLSPNGNDKGDGTLANPLKSISTAIGRFGGTARLVLHLEEGTYTEVNPLEVSACASVEMVGTGTGTTAVYFNYTQYGGYFTTNGIQFNGFNPQLDGLTFNGARASIDNCYFSDFTTAIVFRNGTTGVVTNTQIVDCVRAIWALNGAYVAAHNITGSDVGEGYRTTAGIISVGTSVLNATTPVSKFGGGVVFRGGNLYGTTSNTFVNAT